MSATLTRVRDAVLYRGGRHLAVEGGGIVLVAAACAAGACGLLLA